MSSRRRPGPPDAFVILKEALKKIMEINPNAKVLMCTGLGQQKLVIQAIELGAKGYIVKPFQAEFVIKEIERILSG